MSTQPGNVSNATGLWIQNNLGLVKKLPEPGDRWEIRDVDGLRPQDMTKLRQMGVINAVDRLVTKDREAYYWKTDEQCWRVLQDKLENRSVTPCGHSGVRCLEAGETYTCTNERCEETFGRDAAMEAVQ